MFPVYGCWRKPAIMSSHCGDSLLDPSCGYGGRTLTLVLGYGVTTLWHLVLGLHSQLTGFPRSLPWAIKFSCQTQQQGVTVPILCRYSKHAQSLCICRYQPPLEQRWRLIGTTGLGISVESSMGLMVFLSVN